jgi:protein-disulfide isomerase
MKVSLTLPVGERDHVEGSGEAPITLVEYGDYECPHCGAAYPIVKALQRELGSKLRFVYRNFPIREIHRHAQAAAEAAEAAGAQDRFWAMHDSLFEGQERLELSTLLQRAVALQLDVARWERDMRGRAFSERVQEDFLSGLRSGVNGTPTFFINGRRHDGPFDAESLLAAMETALEPEASSGPAPSWLGGTAT